MKNKTNKVQGKKLLYIVIPILILLFIALRFIIYYFKTDGFSGISMLLPLLLIGLVIFALAASASFAAWVYEDCKNRCDDGVLWAIIVFVTTPFIGMLVYFLRRSSIKQTCSFCEHKISLSANYCEHCGKPTEHMEDIVMVKKTHHLKLIITGIICIVLMLTCLVGFIINAAADGNVNTDITSNKKVWNTGIISMNYETNLNGIWKLDFKSASDGFIKEDKFKIENASAQKLYADIYCEDVPDGATLTLWIVQGTNSKSIDVTNLKTPLEYALNEFTIGDARVRLQINGVKNVTSEIHIK